jgi:hypothetical protein
MAESFAGAVARGALAGVAATLAMSALMLARRAKGKTGRLPPSQIVRASLERVGVEPSRRLVGALTTAAHFGYGAGAGGLYGALHRRLRSPIGLVDGLIYGAAVWAASYAGWIPALGILPPPQRDRPARQRAMLLAHLLYGGVLGALAGGARRRKTVTAPAPSPYLRDRV